MKTLRIVVAVATIVAAYSSNAHAGFSCAGLLTSAQQTGFERWFTPRYSASLTHVGGRVEPANMAKSLSAADLKRLAKPTMAASAELSAERASILKGWLNENAGESVPGWFSTSVGLIVPEAWVALAADAFLQMVDKSGDAGRLQAANIAGTVSQGGMIGIGEQVSKDGKFVYSYLYQAQLNGKRITVPLMTCVADVVRVDRQTPVPPPR